MWSDIGYLCTETESLDAMERPVKAFTEKQVFCDSIGVKRTEFYQANAAGYKPELCVRIRKADYANESHFKFNGTTYRILRTYPVKNENLELICVGLVVNG